jgi:hypothetical protein
MIIAADDVSDAHIPVVYHHAEIIGRGSVGALNNEIVKLAVFKLEVSLYGVIKGNYAVIRVSETDYIRLVRRMLRVIIAAVTVIARLQTVFHLLFAHALKSLFRAVALVGSAVFEHFINDFLIAVKTLGLVVRTFIPVKIEPVHGI